MYMKQLAGTWQVGSNPGPVRFSAQLTIPQLLRTSKRQVWCWQSVQSLLDSWSPGLVGAPDRSLPSSSEVPPLLPGSDPGPSSALPVRAWIQPHFAERRGSIVHRCGTRGACLGSVGTLVKAQALFSFFFLT